MQRRAAILLSLCLGSCGILAAARADALRVTSWNLRPNLTGTNAWSPKVQAGQIQEAADALRKIKPDVIVLQQVANWKACDDLAKALEPENYQVVVCSAFRDPRTKAPRSQVAILSRSRTYISWSEPWRTNGAPGGFAFAALRVGDKNTGIFSIQLSDDADADLRGAGESAAREESLRQLIKQIAALQNWTTNRLDALVIAGDFNASIDDVAVSHEKTLSLLAGFGFQNALASLPPEQRVTLAAGQGHPDATVDYIFTRNAGRVETPRLTQTALTSHYALTSDLDLNAMSAVHTPAQIAKATPVETSSVANSPIVAAAPAPPSVVSNQRMIVGTAAGCVAVCVGLFLFVRRRSRRGRDQLVLADHPPFTHIAIDAGTGTQLRISGPGNPMPLTPTAPLPDAVREGVTAQLTHWFKQKFVQRLVADRAQLLETQQTAALKVLAVDERLAKIERQIQERNHEYEQRIDELLKELANTREENRELIRAKIALVKAEMEKERIKAEGYVQSQRQNP